MPLRKLRRIAGDRWRSLWDVVAGGRRSPEGDVPPDSAHAGTRAEGGEPDPNASDRHSTTGTTPSGHFVGRASGDDVGYADETGAERRASRPDRDTKNSQQ